MSKLLFLTIIVCSFCSSTYTYQAKAADARIKITSKPVSASVFHLLRGKYYLLGHTPLSLTKEELGGKTRTQLLISRFGYDEQLMPVSVDGKKYHVTLKDASYTIDSSDWKNVSNRNMCKANTGRALDKIKSTWAGENPFLLSEHTKIYSGGSAEHGLILTGRLIDARVIKSIKREFRIGRKGINTRLHQHLDPHMEEYINLFKQAKCFDFIDIVLDYKDKGIVQKFVPTQVGWSAITNYQTVNNKTETLVQWGTSTELRSEIDVKDKRKRLRLQYSIK